MRAAFFDDLTGKTKSWIVLSKCRSEKKTLPSDSKDSSRCLFESNRCGPHLWQVKSIHKGCFALCLFFEPFLQTIISKRLKFHLHSKSSHTMFHKMWDAAPNIVVLGRSRAIVECSILDWTTPSCQVRIAQFSRLLEPSTLFNTSLIWGDPPR